MSKKITKHGNLFYHGCLGVVTPGEWGRILQCGCVPTVSARALKLRVGFVGVKGEMTKNRERVSTPYKNAMTHKQHKQHRQLTIKYGKR